MINKVMVINSKKILNTALVKNFKFLYTYSLKLN